MSANFIKGSLLIPVFPGGQSGATYRYTDKTLEANIAGYNYWLEVMDIHGTKVMMGPVPVRI